jgi:pyridoxamine 5'-phosphate oxidase
VTLLREWFDGAVTAGVREPGAIALATVSASGRPSSRMIQTSRITDRGLVFTTHSVSPKAREITETGWASGVMYWHATNQQVLFTARAEQLPDAEAEALWAARPVAVLPMSAVTMQSQPLEDERALLEAARRLGGSGQRLPRPATFVAFELVPSAIEFWQSSPDRLYRRLRYDRTGDGWTAVRLQP